MSRIQLQIPRHTIYNTTIKIRITDLNYGNHMGNDALVSILHEARCSLYSYLGFTESTISGNLIGFISDLAVIYKAEAFHGDELDISMTIDDFNKYGYDIFYTVVRKSDDKLVAKAKTGIVLFDITENKISGLTEALKSHILANTKHP